MPLIKKIKNKIIGEINVNFSNRLNRFEVVCAIPIGFKYNTLLFNWNDVEKYIKVVENATLYKSKFIKKVIYMDFKTSPLEKDKQDKQEKFILDETARVLDTNVGFSLDWWVLDEFSSSGRHNIFKIVESHKGQRGSDIGKIDILPQLFYNKGQVLDYSDELYDFLVNSSEKLRVILKQMVDFINIDPKVLMENILNNNGQLKIG